jgi:murein DD-endopeptidase MepM/ murein hydrolase activator NlpD
VGRGRRIILALIVALFATVASVRLFIVGPDENTSDAVALQDADVAGHISGQVVEDPQVVNPAPDPIIVSLTLDHSASVGSYLEDAGLDRADAQRWAWFFQNSANVRNFQSGHSLTLYKDPETGELRGLKYNLDERIAVSELTYGDGVMRVSQELIRYVERPVAISFQLRNDFLHEAERNELPKRIVATLEYAFNDRHRLSDLPLGSDIKLIYQEKVSRDGTARSVTGLEAAQIRFGGKTLTAFAFQDENGEPHLYDANGEALEPASLHFPVNFQYISSGFTFRRYHPILHAYRPHMGVDLAAHYGTPVKAVADGRVEAAGWCGELGHCVRIHHDGGIVSIYGHLSQISPGLEGGTYVHVGEVIGRVGSSGLSTGPHLHYALEKDGRYVNPLTESLGIHHHVSPRMRLLFDRFKDDYLATLDRLPDFGGRFTAPHLLTAFSAHSTPDGGMLAAKSKKASTRSAPAQLRVERTVTTTVIDGRASVMR